jgi:alcohol dehydrogenase class IV
MTSFSFETTPRIVCEQGAALRLPELLLNYQAKRVFVVTDAGLLKTGVLEPALAALRRAGIEPVVHAKVLADPPEAVVLEAVRHAVDCGSQLVMGMGGGSSLDTAKLVALLARSPQALSDIYGIGLARGPRLGLVQIPTTAGTGSEVTPIAILTTPSQEKKGVVSPLLYPDMAVLDSQLTLGLPPAITAMTGVDAMVHAIEAFTSRHKKNPMSDLYAVKALQLLHANIRTVVSDGRNADAREHMLLGSLMAGMAFANAPVGAVHALAYPLGGRFHLPHGLSNSLMLLPVLEFNLSHAQALYAELGRAVLGEAGDAHDAAQGFIASLRSIVQAMPYAQHLRAAGIGAEDLPTLASDAMNVQRLLTNNPREVQYADALALYQAAL